MKNPSASVTLDVEVNTSKIRRKLKAIEKCLNELDKIDDEFAEKETIPQYINGG